MEPSCLGTNKTGAPYEEPQGQFSYFRGAASLVLQFLASQSRINGKEVCLVAPHPVATVCIHTSNPQKHSLRQVCQADEHTRPNVFQDTGACCRLQSLLHIGRLCADLNSQTTDLLHSQALLLQPINDDIL
jgi:hypothetical protein